MIRVGTCSWADESFVKAWYPRGIRSGEERLRYYADHFDVVEANSTFYRLPDEALVASWAERTPDGFVMHMKAFGMMTRHAVKADVLPPDLREAAPVDQRGRVDRPPRELRAEVFRRFAAALEPLRAAAQEIASWVPGGMGSVSATPSLIDVTFPSAWRKVTSKSFFFLPSRLWKTIRWGESFAASTIDSTRLSTG